MMADQETGANSFSAALSRVTALLGTLTTRQKMIGGGVIAGVFVLLLALSSMGGGGDGGRAITINGQRMTNEQVAYLDMLAGGNVPDGNYWLDPQSGLWGIVGNPQPMGQIGGGGQAQGGAPHWADVGQNYRGPFGDYMSDGQGCSAVNGILVGNC
jgi:hypothetical protein